jgi:hypothetical protein
MRKHNISPRVRDPDQKCEISGNVIIMACNFFKVLKKLSGLYVQGKALGWGHSQNKGLRTTR